MSSVIPAKAGIQTAQESVTESPVAVNAAGLFRWKGVLPDVRRFRPLQSLENNLGQPCQQGQPTRRSG